MELAQECVGRLAGALGLADFLGEQIGAGSEVGVGEQSFLGSFDGQWAGESPAAFDEVVYRRDVGLSFGIVEPVGELGESDVVPLGELEDGAIVLQELAEKAVVPVRRDLRLCGVRWLRGHGSPHIPLLCSAFADSP